MLPITTTKEIWRRLTGLQGAEKSNIRIKVPSWGEEVSLVGAPVKGTLTIGTLKVSNPISGRTGSAFSGISLMERLESRCERAGCVPVFPA